MQFYSRQLDLTLDRAGMLLSCGANASEMSIFVFNSSMYPDLQDKMHFPHIPPALLSNTLWNAAQG